MAIGCEQGELVEMSPAAVLAFAEAEHAKRQKAERNLLKAAYQWAVLHNPDRLPPTDKRGRERAKPAGGAGTPLITEYAAAAFGARIQTSPFGAKKLIADAVDIVLRLPRIQGLIDTGEASSRHARHVAEATRELSESEAAWVDGEVAESCDGRLSWARFEALVEGKVAAAAPELARLKEEAAAREVFARMSRVSKHGMATYTVHGDAMTIAGINAAANAVADSEDLKESMPGATANERRVAAVARLMNPAAHLDPAVGPVKVRVKVYLHLYGDSPIARMEGHGPVTTDWVRHRLGIDGNVRVTRVADLNNQVPVDAYEIPARMREAVRLIHPGDVFPFAANTGRRLDLDHAIPYSEGGETAVGNLGPLTRTHHRIKTHAGWEVRQPFPGIVVWRDPYGAHYLVDATGTRRVTGTPGGQSLTPAELHFTQTLVNYLAA
ncbi:HNH endonuclease signature motif containing protein [Nocardioides sp. WS12]|uniref:HNH endonuclease signature motif containing protein n=1 Tax=Nocardioides sp. WS12 TaxID=2486272 RepID=UPI0015FB4F70|nr:HNH endonuclease signature motif containing protein [Nocardioides sp. WS12]